MSNPNEDKTVSTSEANRPMMNNVVRMPFEVKTALDNRLHLKDGKVLADWWGDEGVCSLGYNSPEVLQAIHCFLSTGQPHQLPDIYPSAARTAAAEIICGRTQMDRIFFANSGTEANEAAIKIARKHWWDKEANQHRHDLIGQRHLVLTMEGNFHGRTGLSLAAGDFRVSPYHRHGFGPSAKGFGVLDEDFNLVLLDGEEVVKKSPCWADVAAIILAPVLGNNLVKTYPKEFWERLAAIRTTHDTLLIYDDVQAGSGRAGYYATWQHPDIQVKPDIMTLAKGMAMGFPMSCMLASEQVAEAFTPGVHFNTFGGSPFVCHMAEHMYIWLDRHLAEVRAKGELLRDTFNALGWIKECDGSGLLNAFTPDYEAHDYNGFEFMHEARTVGLSIATHREFGPIRFTPPLNVTFREIELACQMLVEVHERLISRCD